MRNKDDDTLDIIEYIIPMLSRENADAAEESACAVQSQEQAQYEYAARKIKRFIDELPGGFLIYRADGDESIIYANAALLDIFGCKTLEAFKSMTGNSFKGMVHPDDLEEVELSIKEQIEVSQNDLDYVEYRILRKDGGMRWVEDYGHFVHSDAVGDIFYVFITDATEKINRRNSEKAALISAKHEKEKKLLNLIETYDKERMLIRQEHLQRLEVIEGLSVNYDSILYADLDADRVLAYRLSMRLERQFDRKLQARDLGWFLDDYVNVWVHPDDRERVAELTSPDSIRKKLKNNATYYINYRCVYKGETQYIQLRIVNVGSKERVSQIVMGYRNVDVEVLQEMKQKQLLQEALENAKLADVAKNTFLSNMSHDMRTPLNAIFGFTALARKNLHDNKAVGKYLNKIETAGKQILDLIEKVLSYSYTESQDFRLNNSDCDIVEVIKGVHAYILPQAAAKRITVTADTDAIKHKTAVVDPEKLGQILMHITSNAVKYTDDGGSVRITAREKAKPNSDFSTYTFEIADTGIGISEEFRRHIFDPFEREKNTTFSGEFGTGLGLTIAKHTAEMMGGNIEVKSKVGKGSVFTVTMLLKRRDVSPARSAKSADDAMPDLRGKKVLLVEDSEINIEIETEMLQDIGLIVDCAENGQIAVDTVKASSPGEYSFILMDIQMPVMDGRTAASEIRKLDDPVLSDIPIIALSANAFESDKRMSMEVGMDAHLTKPIDVPLLVKTVKRTLKKHAKKQQAAQ